MTSFYIKNKLNIISLLALLFMLSIQVKSQSVVNPNNPNNLPYIANRGCGTAILPQQYETWVQSLSANNTPSRLGGAQAQSVFNIPVVVHVIHNNEAINSVSATTGGNLNAAQIQNQINILNQDFNGLNADTNLIPSAFKPFQGKFQFNFCLAVVNPTGGVMSEPGIDRISRTTYSWSAPPYSTSYIDANIKPATIWNPTKYMNMWVCGISGGILGYATFPSPGTSGLQGLTGSFGTSTTDGLVMRNTAFGSIGTAASGAPYNKGRTATHEIGHWLGLRHIWGDNGQCGATDYCNDTPPQRGGNGTPPGANYGCPTYPLYPNTCTISSQSNTNGDMFMNYMDYTNDACMYMFTNDQKTRAQLIMTNSPLRLGLLTSTVCNAPTVVNDIGILFVSSPTYSQNITCSTSINPSVMLYNFGTNTITSATFSYNINGVGTQTFVWTGVIAPSSSLNVGMPTVSGLTNGIKFYNVGVYLPNGTTDPNTSNNTSNQAFTISNAFNFTMSPSSMSVCPNNTAVIILSGANSYTLQPGNVAAVGPNTAFIVNPSQTTIYTVSAFGGSCVVSQQFSAYVNPVGTLSVTSNQTICSGASTTLQATGVSSYTWNTGANTSAIVVSPTASTTYTVSGTIGSCIYTNTVTVAVGNLAININSLSLCPGNAGTLVANGASNYTWSTGSNNQSIVVNPSITTTYSVIGTSGSCSGTATRVVTILPTPTITGVPTNTSICQGLAFIFNPSGACTYTFSGSSNTVIPTVSTVYTVVGTHCTSGCLGSCTMSLTVNPTPTLSILAGQSNICSGDSSTLTVSGATSYSWSNGAIGNVIYVSPSGSSIYTVVGTSSACSSSSTVSIIVTPTPTLILNNYTICSGGSATLNANGASSYTWSTGANTASIIVSPVVNTIYTVSGSNANCVTTKTVSVDIGTALSLAINSPSSICAGNTATLSASGANSYTWSNNTNNPVLVVSPSVTTTYSLFGTNGACSGNAVQTISVNAVPLVSAIASPSTPICAGATVNLSASGAASYTWSNGSNSSQISVSPTSTSIYTVTGSNNGCNNTATVTVNTSGTAITLTLTTSATNICSGSQATIAALGASNYTWSNGTNSTFIVVNPSVTSIYSVTGSNGACAGNSSVTINVIAPGTIAVTASPSFSVCSGQTVFLTAAGNFTSYTWSNSPVNSPSTMIIPTVTTNYTVTASGNSVACASKTIVTVVVNPMPITTITVTNASCGNACNGRLNVNTSGGTTPYTYSLSGSTCTSMPCTNLCSGLYTLKTTDAAGCTQSHIFSVSNSLNNIIANITATHATCSACNNGALSVSPLGGTSPYSYTWAPTGGNGSVANNLSTGCYTVTIRDTAGCATTSWACIGIGTGINSEVVYLNNLQLFPNPSKEILNIQVEGFVFDYRLYSSLGQLIKTANNINSFTSLNMETLSKGIYVVEINVGDAVIRKKIVKE